jgi:replication factor C subunit 1
MNQLWYEKYRPTTFDELFLPHGVANTCKKWIENFGEKVPNTPPCLFLYGPPGIGKTSMAKILFKTYGYEVMEFNASEIRNASQIRSKIEEINGRQDITSIMCFKNRNIAIIMDEIDGMSSGDRGGLSELLDIIFPKKKGGKKKEKSSGTEFPKSPFICITNTLDKKIKTMKTKSCDVRMYEPDRKQLFRLAMHICQSENIKCDESLLLHIVPHAQGDYRRLVNILEYLWYDVTTRGNTIEWVNRSIEHFDKKNKYMTCYQTAEKILLQNLTHSECIEYERKDSSMTKMLLEENALPHIIKNRKTHPKKSEYVAELYDSFSGACMFDNAVYSQQAWEMNEYSSYYKTIKTNQILHRKLEPYSFHKYKDVNHSVKLNKNSHEIIFRKNRDELIHCVDRSSSDKTLPYYSNIIMTMILYGKHKEVSDFCNKNEISWDDFEKKIVKWSDIDTKDLLTTTLKKNMKKGFLN